MIIAKLYTQNIQAAFTEPHSVVKSNTQSGEITPLSSYCSWLQKKLKTSLSKVILQKIKNYEIKMEMSSQYH